ncbi:MAG: bifunctional 5,10-methylenetetrahydrofolate dehydrogenase/5,10-methenyltetrahydrofolate cyclohydrolase [Armatimonadota bacterium]
MAARLLEGKPVADAIREHLKVEVAEFTQREGRAPCIAAVLVGEDEASVMYAGRITRVHESLGMTCRCVSLPEDVQQAEVLSAITRLNSDPEVDGILPLLPLPAHVNTHEVIAALDPSKDVDGIHPQNAGRLFLGLDAFIPNTPAGGMEILDFYGIELKGKHAVVVGRSNIVGKPMAILLLARHATVTLCHSRTTNLADVCRLADVLVAAVGKAKLIKGDWIKPGAVVIDFGINPTDDGITGDVDFEAAREIAEAITPVPGGTGPITNLMLARNTIKAACMRTGRR